VVIIQLVKSAHTKINAKRQIKMKSEVDEVIMALIGTDAVIEQIKNDPTHNTLYRLLQETIRTNIQLRNTIQEYKIRKLSTK